jgi:hypothetical protein
MHYLFYSSAHIYFTRLNLFIESAMRAPLMALFPTFSADLLPVLKEGRD